MDDPLYEVYQITSSYFCAGITLYEGIVVEAAPILSYMRESAWRLSHVKDYVGKKGWKIERIH